MAYLPTFRRGKRDQQSSSLARWWTSSKENVAKDLYAYCVALERAQRPERFRRYAYHIMATGRAPLSYGLSMPGMATDLGSYAGDAFDARFTPPSENYPALAIDVFANKVWAERPHLQLLPVTDDDYKVRLACKQGTTWVAQVFEDLKLWDLVAAVGKASGITGTGWARVGEAGPGRIEVTHVQDDNVLLDPTAGSNPRSKQIRLFRDRQSLIQQYAVGPNADAIRDKLERATACRLGFFAIESIAYGDTIAVIEAWFGAGPDGTPGRHVIAIDDLALVDEAYEHPDAPLAKLVHEPIEESARGQGLVEQILPLQREIDRIAENLAIQERIMAFGQTYSRQNNGVTEEDCAGTFIEYAFEKPHREPGLAPPAQLYAKQRELGQNALLRVGISPSAAQGQTSPGITAAVAIQADLEVADVRHRAHTMRLETFVEDLGRLILRQAATTKPVVMARGKQIDFEVVEKALKQGRVEGYPVSGLPQSIAGRKQEISDRYKNGQIDRAMYQRLLGLPTTDQEADEETAALDLIYWQLDRMVETGKFQPVLPFSDLVSAKATAIKRYQIETMRGLARDRLQLIAQYVAQVQERLDESTPAPQAPAPAPVPPAGAAPAAL